MRVFTISHLEYGIGYITAEIDNLIREFEVELEENGEIEEFKSENIPKIRESIEKLPTVADGDAGAMVSFGSFLISASEMSQEEYDSLPEFGGW